LAPPPIAYCGDRQYRIVRHANGAALRYERLESKADERQRKKAEKRARRAGAARMKVNHFDIVQQVHQEQPPISGDLASVFAYQQRVLARLARQFPAERWGYLKKGGDNTITFAGETVKVGRVCGPDSQLYKIATDVPTTNAPVWNDDGVLTVDFPGTDAKTWYLPFEDVAVDPGDPGGDITVIAGNVAIMARLDRIDEAQNRIEEALAVAAQSEAARADMVNRLENFIKAVSDQVADLRKFSEELKLLAKAGRRVHMPYLGGGTIDPL
jgi:hypothetical protein